MRISDAAKTAGVGVETIRFYERKGLVEQPKRPLRGGGFRSYSQEAVARIRFIRQAQEIGFSLREIKKLLSLRVDPDADCGEMRVYAQTKLDEVNRKIASLKKIKAELEELIEACPGRGAALCDCSILEVLTRNVLDEDSSDGRVEGH